MDAAGARRVGAGLLSEVEEGSLEEVRIRKMTANRWMKVPLAKSQSPSFRHCTCTCTYIPLAGNAQLRVLVILPSYLIAPHQSLSSCSFIHISLTLSPSHLIMKSHYIPYVSANLIYIPRKISTNEGEV